MHIHIWCVSPGALSRSSKKGKDAAKGRAGDTMQGGVDVNIFACNMMVKFIQFSNLVAFSYARHQISRLWLYSAWYFYFVHMLNGFSLSDIALSVPCFIQAAEEHERVREIARVTRLGVPSLDLTAGFRFTVICLYDPICL